MIAAIDRRQTLSDKMKFIGSIALFFFANVTQLPAADLVLPYRAFGPQIIAHELIGMQWWQWEGQGDDRPREYPINVVIYWNQTLAETRKRFPVDPAQGQDFRYVEYSKAIRHMTSAIETLRREGLDAANIERSQRLLQEAHRKTEGGQ